MLSRNCNMIDLYITVTVTQIENMIPFVVGQGSDSCSRELETSIIFGLFQENQLNVTVIKSSNHYDLMVDFDQGSKSSQLFVVEADSNWLKFKLNLEFFWKKIGFFI